MPLRSVAVALAMVFALIGGARSAEAGQTADAVVERAVEAVRSLPPEQRLEAARRIQAESLEPARKPRHPVLRLFNMTNWLELPWFLIGLTGQLAFFARMAVQWIVSEKRRESVVPPVFWWLSLVGAAFLTTYGVWRQDVVIILGQALGVFIYTRNLWLIRANKAANATDDPG